LNDGIEIFSVFRIVQCDEDENPSTQSDVNGLLSTKVVDVPSQQKKRLIAFLLWLNGQLNRIYSSLVDVPSQ
jgi:hypothetical protein